MLMPNHSILIKAALGFFLLVGLVACSPGATQPVEEMSPTDTGHQFATHTPVIEQSAGALQPANTGENDIEEPSSHNPSTDCTEQDPHPIGQSIAQTYEISYEQVMLWFCSGYSFENILIALETEEAVDIPAEVLLEMVLDKEWEEIWKEVGLDRNE
jgi:hypothetical protein